MGIFRPEPGERDRDLFYAERAIICLGFIAVLWLILSLWRLAELIF